MADQTKTIKFKNGGKRLAQTGAAVVETAVRGFASYVLLMKFDNIFVVVAGVYLAITAGIALVAAIYKSTK